ncbi:Mo-dependent nitrogenase C-terminal domain-containing protein [Geitlerinema sp. PCC 9228]|jgi:hypothetical protein|uniref:Mo-dependent nitrogenase C-terminal domain-containing protein n=1 Tax=Geitlerinema sp. PCC 9228 TaxID=111611 RepID=UPI000A014051|nr:Mo-dependent nitrogenase C-terminal domain-containing protein [Geitlerinema sp. PCC 9228]
MYLANRETHQSPQPYISNKFLAIPTQIRPLQPIRQWLENLEINTPELARSICQMIPAQCPFARDIQIAGRTLIRIPPLCKLNPLYEELICLRFRALCYLVEECGEDVSI